jgi:hypothetical protein
LQARLQVAQRALQDSHLFARILEILLPAQMLNLQLVEGDPSLLELSFQPLTKPRFLFQHPDSLLQAGAQLIRLFTRGGNLGGQPFPLFGLPLLCRHVRRRWCGLQGSQSLLGLRKLVGHVRLLLPRHVEAPAEHVGLAVVSPSENGALVRSGIDNFAVSHGVLVQIQLRL